MNPELWRGRRVLVTGHTGFKGSWLIKWLDMMGAVTLGISLEADGFSPYDRLVLSERHKSLVMDIGEDEGLGGAVSGFAPEVVFHLAAQAIVGCAYERPVYTFRSNVMGMVRLLDSLRNAQGLRAVVAVTSDKVYENRSPGRPFREDDRLGADEPYAASKSCQELAAQAYAGTYFEDCGVSVATARGSNVYGGGDHHYDRLIPGIIEGMLTEQKRIIRSPKAVRPWQYVLCLLEGYVRLAEELLESPSGFAGGWNFGPPAAECVTVGEVAKLLSGEVTAGGRSEFHEAAELRLDSQKSEQKLGWHVRVPLTEGLARTKRIYIREHAGEHIDKLMKEELEWYGEICTDRPWQR